MAYYECHLDPFYFVQSSMDDTFIENKRGAYALLSGIQRQTGID